MHVVIGFAEPDKTNAKRLSALRNADMEEKVSWVRIGEMGIFLGVGEEFVEK